MITLAVIFLIVALIATIKAVRTIPIGKQVSWEFTAYICYIIGLVMILAKIAHNPSVKEWLERY